MNTLLPVNEPTLENLKRQLRFLDQLVALGETPDEISHEVSKCAHLSSVLFFGWLMNKGLDDGVEVLASMAKEFVTDIYLDEQTSRRCYCKLSKVTKKQLATFLNLVDFAVPEELWRQHINPFDGLLLFYQFLDYVGYDADVPRRKRFLAELKRSVVKKPCSVVQSGHYLMQ